MTTPSGEPSGPRGVRVNRSLTIPEGELELRFSPSGGPGGQHANKVATRAELTWNIAGSNALDEDRRARLLARLAPRLDASGALRITSDTHRSQLRNRKDVLDRLARIVAEGLRAERKRTKTTPTRASKEKRLRAKRKRSEAKDLRRQPDGE
ncbi:MAG: aminoacyl-tRNA hydrolase [Actinobacteria bacterium]|nr:aminoacyl-tRNA hydrolase [Actinomycetota bacterium]